MSLIKNISIKQYLENRNINPIKDRNYYGMYLSPFRNDNNPSFKVDYEQNLWHDFGTGEGGSIIDLVMKMDNCNLSEAIRKLQNKESVSESLFFQRNMIDKTEKQSVKQTEPKISIFKEIPIGNPALISYLNERHINIEIAKQHCSEIHYEVNGKPYYAIGFKNDNNGFILRNNFFKGCTSSDITTIDKGKSHCCVFEGFIDYLSFLSLKNEPSIESNIVVLNSVNNLNKASDFLKRHNTIYTFLDNDEAGKRCLNEIQKLGKTVSDQSQFYGGYKDINDYLCGKKQVQQKQQKRGIRF